jgi:hypothetical protein
VNDFQSVQAFQPYLFAGERVLWTGQPKQGIAFHGSDIYLIPFSLVWMGFVLFASAGALNDLQSPDIMLLLFLAFGAYFTVGRFIHDALIRMNTRYAVTNQRALILRGSSKLTSYEISRLPMLQLNERSDGSGTILFDSEDVGYSWLGRRRGFGAWTPSAGNSAQFYRIDNPRRVYELIRNQAHS